MDPHALFINYPDKATVSAENWHYIFLYAVLQLNDFMAIFIRTNYIDM